MLLEYLAFAQCSVAYVPTGFSFPKAGISLPWDSGGVGGGPWGVLSPVIRVMELRVLHGWG